jgi:hypothetical protein
VKRPSHFIWFLFGLAVVFWMALPVCGSAQKPYPAFWGVPDQIDPVRLGVVTGGGTLMYGLALIGLNKAWYEGHERAGFRTFNDWKEWERVDKWGHAQAAYTYGYLSYGAFRWTGMKRNASIWAATGVSVGLQTTVEIMDAFSARWGFSWHDLAFNLMGTALFTSQQFLWDEQRIRLKVSNHFPRYSAEPLPPGGETSLKTRADELFGTHLLERFIKDYNGMTVWWSINPTSFLRKEAKVLRWLNVAVGIGAENMYGAAINEWPGYDASLTHPRYRQFYLSLDVDLSRIRTRSGFLKFILGTLNFIKIPAPTLEINTRGQVIFHPIFF